MLAAWQSKQLPCPQDLLGLPHAQGFFSTRPFMTHMIRNVFVEFHPKHSEVPVPESIAMGGRVAEAGDEKAEEAADEETHHEAQEERHLMATHPAKFIHRQKQSILVNPAPRMSSSFHFAATGTKTPSRDRRFRSISSLL